MIPQGFCSALLPLAKSTRRCNKACFQVLTKDRVPCNSQRFDSLNNFNGLRNCMILKLLKREAAEGLGGATFQRTLRIASLLLKAGSTFIQVQLANKYMQIPHHILFITPLIQYHFRASLTFLLNSLRFIYLFIYLHTRRSRSHRYVYRLIILSSSEFQSYIYYLKNKR